MRRKILTALAGLCAVTMSLTVKCQAFSFFTENEESEAACAWLQDDGYYYLPDLDEEDMENIKIAESNAASRWQYIDSEGTLTDELTNFSSSGHGNKYLGFSEDKKYVYFFTEISEQIKSGTLCYVETKYLTNSSEETAKHIIKVDNDVFTSVRPLIRKDGSILYSKMKGDLYSGTLCCFDGKQTISVAEEIIGFEAAEDNLVYYTRWNEFGEEESDRQGEYDLYGAVIGKKDSERQIGSDIYDYQDTSGRMEMFYVNGKQIYFLDGGKNFCKSSYDGEKEILLSDNVYTVLWEQEKVTYIHKDSSQPDTQDEDGETDIVKGSIHMYDCKTGEDQLLSEKCKIIMEQYEDGEIDSVCWPGMTQTSDGKLVFSYIDADGIEKNDSSLYTFYMEISGSNEPIYLQDMSVENIEYLNMVTPSVYLFNDGQNFALDENGLLTVGTLSGASCSGRETIESDVKNVKTISGKLFYEKNDTVYWYNGSSSTPIGSVYDDYDTYYKGYDNGNVLMLVYYSGRQYGGTLVQIGVNNYKYEIDSNVTDFWELESGDILYITEGKLILYSGSVKTRIADNVKTAWPLSEETVTDKENSGW
ncbi:MAG: hypothetical protein Q4P27_04390 [Eubacteriales bacterium]|nr:hypothetical protein [Eubacteriales bacterium]